MIGAKPKPKPKMRQPDPVQQEFKRSLIMQKFEVQKQIKLQRADRADMKVGGDIERKLGIVKTEQEEVAGTNRLLVIAPIVLVVGIVAFVWFKKKKNGRR